MLCFKNIVMMSTFVGEKEYTVWFVHSIICLLLFTLKTGNCIDCWHEARHAIAASKCLYCCRGSNDEKPASTEYRHSSSQWLGHLLTDCRSHQSR